MPIIRRPKKQPSPAAPVPAEEAPSPPALDEAPAPLARPKKKKKPAKE